LFIAFINDLIEALEKHGVIVKLFADDTKIYIRIRTDANVSTLQRAVDRLAILCGKIHGNNRFS